MFEKYQSKKNLEEIALYSLENCSDTYSMKQYIYDISKKDLIIISKLTKRIIDDEKYSAGLLADFCEESNAFDIANVIFDIVINKQKEDYYISYKIY